MVVELYIIVYIFVSIVRGKKRDDVIFIECIKVVFLGGLMIGVFKLRIMEILDVIESGLRGVYLGIVGFFLFNFVFDLNIVIRILVFLDGEVCIGVGGVVIVFFDLEVEYEEMLLKIRVFIRVMVKFEGDYIVFNSYGNRGVVVVLFN